MNLNLLSPCLWLTGVLGVISSATLSADDAKPRPSGPVIIFGVDGLSPDGVMKAATPNMRRLMKGGAHSFHARSVMPTSSSPNWASMIMGAGPEQHGITSNDWETNKFEITPTVTGPGGIFPSIFSLIREQHPTAVVGSFYDWDGFGRLMERSMVDAAEHCDGPTNTILRAIAFIREKKSDFIFIQLDHVDHAGHEYGHGTREYYNSVEVADHLLGQLLAALEESDLLATTTIVVTSDHGGVNKGHGKATMAEIEIPWIISGPGIAKGRELAQPVNIYDTAATVAQIMHLKTPEAWIARPVVEAFESWPNKSQQSAAATH